MLNAALIHRRRTELRLSQRALASHVNTTGSFIRNVEAGGNHRDVTLSQLERLAAALALDISDLVITDAPVEGPGADPTGVASPEPALCEGADPPEADAATLGGLLHAAGVLTPTSSLVEVLEWSYERLDAALADLDARLRCCGMRIHRLHHRVGIERDLHAVDAETLQAAVRRHLAVDNINVTEARMLHRLYSDQGLPRDPSNADGVAIAVLVNAGLIEASDENPGAWALAADVNVALLVGEPAPAIERMQA